VLAIHIIADAVLVLRALYPIWPALWTLRGDQKIGLWRSMAMAVT